MLRTENRLQLLGSVVLLIGMALLLFTFFTAYLLFRGELSITVNSGLLLFPGAFSPVIAAVFHLFPLGVMILIGSIVCNKGIQLLREAKTQTQRVFA